MPLSEKRLKSMILQAMEEKSSSKSEKKESSKNLVEATRSLMEIADDFVSEVNRELEGAGNVMKPGMKKALMNYVNKRLG